MSDKRHRGLVDDFADLWQAGATVPDVWTFLRGHPQANTADVLDVLLDDQWRRHEAGCPRTVEAYLAAAPALAADPERKLDLVYGDYRAACRFGTPPDPSALAARFPDLADALGRHIAFDALLSAGEGVPPFVMLPTATEPVRRAARAMNDADNTGTYQPGDAGASAVKDSAPALPPRVGRYRIEKLLGKGGFGLVYLARDDQLQRPVAVKVPHARLVSRPEQPTVAHQRAPLGRDDDLAGGVTRFSLA
jgi:hypothetical protein